MTNRNALTVPFPYTGSKSPIANEIWRQLGDVSTYIEPFAGSAAVLLGRPRTHKGYKETNNDKDGFVTNFFRSMKFDPDAVAKQFDWPANVNEVIARNRWLIARASNLTSSLQADPDFFDAALAGRWAYGMSICYQKDWCKYGCTPHIRTNKYRINRDLPKDYLAEMKARLSRVRILCHDWQRVLNKNALTGKSIGILLDPPYTAKAERRKDLYRLDDYAVGHEVHQWAMDHGNDYRIALCGYHGEYRMSRGWSEFQWDHPRAWGTNVGRERIWFSPACLRSESHRGTIVGRR